MHDVLDRWKTAFDSHRPDTMAEVFTPDALFLGCGPEVVAGRDAVRTYYEAVAEDRRADVTVLHTYTIGEQVARRLRGRHLQRVVGMGGEGPHVAGRAA
ncbi:SgcJ/EcaC family oxidoreductase [Streptomyces sp. NPDC093594]|uniref:YybH family protein n=1 Tax=Streptomyces sp. NPDC093594 TaxID=3155305 RepID=UPI00344CE610